MKPTTKLAFYALLIIVVLVILSRFFKPFEGRSLGVMLDLSSQWKFEFVDEHLNQIIKSKIEGKKGEYAVVISDLNGGEKLFSLNGNQVFPSASLYKLFLLAAAFEELEKGSLKEDTMITAKQEHLMEVLGSEEFGYDKDQEEISHKVSSILSRIATISDNYASIMLAEKIGWEKVRTQAKKLGAESTIITNPISTTASDIALFFEKLYRGEVVSKESSEKIISLLAASKINNRIPAKLPEEIDVKEGTESARQKLKIAHEQSSGQSDETRKVKLEIAHKTAELSRLRHDAGIVYLPDRPYVIVLMSNNVQFEDDTIELLSEISKDVFEYMLKK